MTFAKIEIIKFISKRNVKTSRRVGHFICDCCKKKFCSRPKPKYLKLEHHFCSRQCASLAARKGGAIFNKKENNCLKKYGAAHHFKNKDVQEKRINSCIDKYGGRCPMNSEEVKLKSQDTILKKYGDHHSRLDSIKQKKKDTCLNKYGVDSFTKTKEFRESVDWASVARKGLKTRSKKGMLNVSKIENKFHQFLLNYFNEVKTQIPIREWSLDFYLPKLDTYIQFDGNYWHGIDTSVEELEAKNTKISKAIIRTKERDREREEWFKKNNMRLVRVIEKDFKDKKYDQILTQIRVFK
jgi:G:T-mismatch repair DNA endonuclease (very short patch repair protein)